MGGWAVGSLLPGGSTRAQVRLAAGRYLSVVQVAVFCAGFSNSPGCGKANGGPSVGTCLLLHSGAQDLLLVC